MQHTHLVKGLDYALLQKVRSEIEVKEDEQEREMEKLAISAAESAAAEAEEVSDVEDADEIKFRTIEGRNIYNVVQAYRSRKVERNELFAPGRMAYVIELDEENAETDIPTTLIRSKADVPLNPNDVQTLTTNDIVINKLAQILSYLRQGGKSKKNKRRDKDKPLFKEPDLPPALNSRAAPVGESIYDDIGEYKPTSSGRRRGEDGGTRTHHPYFSKSDDLDSGGGHLELTGELRKTDD